MILTFDDSGRRRKTSCLDQINMFGRVLMTLQRSYTVAYSAIAHYNNNLITVRCPSLNAEMKSEHKADVLSKGRITERSRHTWTGPCRRSWTTNIQWFIYSPPTHLSTKHVPVLSVSNNSYNILLHSVPSSSGCFLSHTQTLTPFPLIIHPILPPSLPSPPSTSEYLPLPYHHPPHHTPPLHQWSCLLAFIGFM